MCTQNLLRFEKPLLDIICKDKANRNQVTNIREQTTDLGVGSRNHWVGREHWVKNREETKQRSRCRKLCVCCMITLIQRMNTGNLKLDILSLNILIDEHEDPFMLELP